MILYIHGFGGSGLGVKANLFREHFKNKDVNFLAPSLSYTPDLAVSTLEEIIQNCLKYEDVKLIGSSLGGFYATYLSNKFNLKAILINPSLKPTKTLLELIQNEKRALNYFDLSYFEFNQNHLNMLKKYQVPKENLKLENFFIMLQKDDEVIDYKVAKEIFDGAKLLITQGGGHSFINIEKYLKDIDNFFDLF
jgi:predicted esterase YcpF (UPF0227 family)